MPIIPPDVTDVRSALVRFVSVRLVLVSFTEDRFEWFRSAPARFAPVSTASDSFVYEVSDAMVLQKSMIDVPEEIPIWEDE